MCIYNLQCTILVALGRVICSHQIRVQYDIWHYVWHTLKLPARNSLPFESAAPYKLQFEPNHSNPGLTDRRKVIEARKLEKELRDAASAAGHSTEGINVDPEDADWLRTSRPIGSIDPNDDTEAASVSADPDLHSPLEGATSGAGDNGKWSRTRPRSGPKIASQMIEEIYAGFDAYLESRDKTDEPATVENEQPRNRGEAIKEESKCDQMLATEHEANLSLESPDEYPGVNEPIVADLVIHRDTGDEYGNTGANMITQSVQEIHTDTSNDSENEDEPLLYQPDEFVASALDPLDLVSEISNMFK